MANEPYVSAVPVLQTERLVLRGHRPDDLDVSHAMWSDPAVTKFIVPKPLSREEVWIRILRFIGHWAVFGYGSWLVEERDSGAYVGEVGFIEAQREIEPRFDAPELGWAVAPAAQGKGYATEAVLAALSWGATARGLHRTLCIIEPANVASVGVARRCGYTELRPITYKGIALMLYERANR